MLKAVRLRNFKCLKQVSVRLAPITVLIGPNGSGKSSLCQALLLLKQSLGQSKLLVDGPYLSLGKFEDILNAEADRKEISIEVGGEVAFPQAKALGLFTEDVWFYYAATFGTDRPIHHEVQLVTGPSELIPGERLTFKGRWAEGRGEASPRTISFNEIRVDLGGAQLVGEALITIGGGYPTDEEEKRKQFEQIYNACQDLFRIPRAAIERIFFVSGIRGVDRPFLPLQESWVGEFTTKLGPSEQASRFVSSFGYQPEISDKVSEWTDQLTGRRIRHRLVPQRQISLEVLGPKVTGNIINEGLGLNQILFPLAQLAAAPPDSTVMIEEPELHLHPKAQGELVKVFLEIVKRERKQIILTTHSEHILFRLLTAVARKELRPEDLAVDYFEKAPEATTSEVRELKVDAKGRLEGGLPGFFEEDLSEFREYLEALAGRSLG